MKLTEAPAPRERQAMSHLSSVSASFTNVGGVAVPVTFSLVRLQMSGGGPTNAGEVWLASTDEGVAERIVLGCEARSFRPEFSGPAHVTDCRVESDPKLAPRYRVSDGDWKVMPYSALLAYQEKQKENQKTLAKTNQNPRSGTKPMVTLLAMALVTGAFIPFLRKAARE